MLTTPALACLVLTWLISASPTPASTRFGPGPNVLDPPAVLDFPAAFPQDTGMVDHEDCEIRVRLFPSHHFLQAETRIAFRSLVDDLGRVHFVIYNDTLRISSVTSGPDTLDFSYDPGTATLTIQLNDTLDAGERDTVLVCYSGYITSRLGSYCRLDDSVGFSMVPYLWYPVAYDIYNSSRRDDFANWRITLTVPRGWQGLSCGVLLDSTLTDSTLTYTWQPTRGYVAVSFGAGPYQMCTRDWGGLHLRYYDADTLAAEAVYAVTGTVLGYLDRTFGPVTFDKLAFFDHKAGFGAAHPSLVMMPLPNDLLPFAHEIGHHWWGISVTRRYSPETWLNEGFANYTAALLYEDSLGLAARREVLDNYAANYLAVPRLQDRAIVPDPVESPHRNAILYQKGAWVLHMLRGVLGDSLFFDAMTAYATTYRDSAVTIADFRRTAEQVSGRALDWFFNQWLYWTGAPGYSYWWRADSLGPARYLVTVGVRQEEALFTMPVRLTTFSGPSRMDTSLCVDRSNDTFRLSVSERPDSVFLDLDDWLLDRGIQMVGVAEQQPVVTLQPSAATITRGVLFLGGLGTRSELPGRNSVMSRAALLDASGRKVIDLTPGANDIRRLSPGVYFVRSDRSDRIKIIIAR